jgi:hypothetical protein
MNSKPWKRMAGSQGLHSGRDSAKEVQTLSVIREARIHVLRCEDSL